MLVGAVERGAPGELRSVDGAGRAKLSFDTWTDQYRFLWKTDRKRFAGGTCWSVTLAFDDGTSSPPLLFAFK